MAWTILLYGATGYSGRLLAQELRQLDRQQPGAYRIVLAGRDAQALEALARDGGMEWSAFPLDRVELVLDAASQFRPDVILNAAGPFATTAPTLAAAAIELPCHYVDINGEADVYETLRAATDRRARQAGIAIAGACGFWAAASNLLLQAALSKLAAPQEPGMIRIAMSRIRTPSRGSVETVWRMMRGQVTLVRKGMSPRPPRRREMLLWHEPVGKLERTFDFGETGKPERRIASAASLVDTLAARLLLARIPRLADGIESYVEAAAAARMAYQFGAAVAPLLALPRVQMLVQQPLGLLAAGPTRAERRHERHVVLLEIEDLRRTPILDWRWETPNVYDFTAQLAAGAAAALQTATVRGWATPAEVLGPQDLAAASHRDMLRGCTLQQRRP